jgi:phosphoribosyl 1,2-cyclic phosphodiesterase
MDHVFTVTFRGVRGSVPVPGNATLKYGGNTSCVQVDVLGHTIILDAGTGLIPLGQQLVKNYYAGGEAARNKRLSAVLLLSHTHHDHLMGLPFYAPLYVGNASLFIYGPPVNGPVTDGRTDLKYVLEMLMDPMFFPADLKEANSRKVIETLQPFDQILLTDGGNEPELVNLQKDYKVVFKDKAIISQYRSLAHPKNGVLVYKIQFGGKSIVYATDIEGYVHGDKRLVQFAKGADILIHDSQYTEEQYTGSFTTQGFGHSTTEMACQVALEAGVRQLVLFHHDPNHNDEMVAKKEELARLLFPNAVAAYEGQIINL